MYSQSTYSLRTHSESIVSPDQNLNIETTMMNPRIMLNIEGRTFAIEPPPDMIQAMIDRGEYDSNLPTHSRPNPPSPVYIRLSTVSSTNHPPLSSLFPPELLMPSAGVIPGPFPDPVPAYTREVAEAAYRRGALAGREGTMEYIRAVWQTSIEWLGLARTVTDEEGVDDEGNQQVAWNHRSLFWRALVFVFRASRARRMH